MTLRADEVGSFQTFIDTKHVELERCGPPLASEKVQGNLRQCVDRYTCRTPHFHMYSHCTDHTAQVTCVQLAQGRIVHRKTFLHPRVMVHPLMHATLSTSSLFLFHLSCITVVLFSEPRPVVHVSNYPP